jgi:PIN domain nuclease of toxin-antitoxin system
MILDASALLAFLLAEPGKERVAEALMEGAVMTTVNFAEVVAKYVLREAKDRAATLLERIPLTLVAVDEDLALRSAFMADLTRPVGLSMGDRICLALGQRTGQTVLTADRSWLDVAGRVGAVVEAVR